LATVVLLMVPLAASPRPVEEGGQDGKSGV